MSKYTIKIINNETQEIDEIECNAIIEGWANGETAGRFSVINAKGVEICLAANNAEDEISHLEKQHILLKPARKHLRKNKITEEV